VPRAAIVQSVFAFAIREINALEGRIVQAEDGADDMLWQQAEQVVAQLEAGATQRQLAAQWVNVRTGEPYSQVHVHRTKEVVERYLKVSPRPRFRDAYNEITNAPPKEKHEVHFSSATPEHYTPPKVIDAVVECLGEIALDPCSDITATVPATQRYTEKDDGLALPWAGTVYMNPPYGRDIDDWVAKLCEEHAAGGVTEAIALLPARTDTQWFRRLRDFPCCFIEGRLTFIGNDDPAPFPSAVFYLGSDVAKFCRHFSTLGDVWRRVEER
jgi:hypothetical protein